MGFCTIASLLHIETIIIRASGGSHITFSRNLEQAPPALPLTLAVASTSESILRRSTGQKAWVASDAWKNMTNQPEAMMCDGIHGDAPIQNVLVDHIIYVKSLNTTTGSYVENFNFVGTVGGDAPFITGCDISPVSSWAYCLNNDGVLTRFGNDKYRFVAKLQTTSAFAGTFGSIQDYFYWLKDNNIFGIPDVDALLGYVDAVDPGIPDFQTIPPVSSASWPFVFDLVSVTGAFEGPDMEDYVLGLRRDKAYLASVTTPIPELQIKTSNSVLNELTFQPDPAWGTGFGAGFHFKNFIFFNANAGNVVMVKKETIDIPGQSVEVEWVGASDPSSANDGLSCHDRWPPGNWGENAGLMLRRRLTEVLPAPPPTLAPTPALATQPTARPTSLLTLSCADDVSGLNSAVGGTSWTCTYYLANRAECGDRTNGVVPQDYCRLSCGLCTDTCVASVEGAVMRENALYPLCKCPKRKPYVVCGEFNVGDRKFDAKDVLKKCPTSKPYCSSKPK